MSRLLLEIERCDCKPYVISCPNPDCSDGIDTVYHLDGHTSERECPRCHGSGTRTVRLVGKVEVEIEQWSNYDGCKQGYDVCVSHPDTSIVGTESAVCKYLLKKYQINALPAELYRRELPDGTITNPDGLRQEDCDD